MPQSGTVVCMATKKSWRINLLQMMYYSLQQQKVKSVKHSTTITELVVVWSLCSVCASVTKSKAVLLYQHFTLFAIESRKISVILYSKKGSREKNFTKHCYLCTAEIFRGIYFCQCGKDHCIVYRPVRRGGSGGSNEPPQLGTWGPQESCTIACIYTAATIVNDIHNQCEHNHTLNSTTSRVVTLCKLLHSTPTSTRQSYSLQLRTSTIMLFAQKSLPCMNQYLLDYSHFTLHVPLDVTMQINSYRSKV